MKLVGYGNRWSVAPGETIRFMVSAEVPSYEAVIVRLIHGDTNPAGPGFKEERVPGAIEGSYLGRTQTYPSGSCVLVPSSPDFDLDATAPMTLRAWIWPTTPGDRAQGLLTRWDESRGAGYAVALDETGALAFWTGDGQGGIGRATTGIPLRAFAWYLVEAIYDPAAGSVSVSQQPVVAWPRDETAARTTAETGVRADSAGLPLVMAAWCGGDGERPPMAGHFNGKIDGPTVERGGATVAVWDFAADIGSARVTDASGRHHHGVAVNMPMRAVTGHNFSGREVCFRLAPDEYGAIFFHDDDLEDARWQVDFAYPVPADLPSGVYAAKLRAEDAEEYIPFFVRPRRGTRTAPVAVLLPTYTYLAYANEHITWRNPDSPVPHDPLDFLEPADHYVDAHRLMSAYDHHADGTGVAFSSRLRPVLNLRPKYRTALLRAPQHFAADLYLTDWLAATGHRFDVLTDEDLHAEGAGLLRPYKVVLTGNHHEYWSGAMLDAVEAYLAGGGRWMSLTGNGYYWPIGIDPERPHAIEIRRGRNGTGTWRSAPGEDFLQTTGEPGGLWRDRGRAPQKLVGVGMAASGFDVGLPFLRTPASHDPRAAFIFADVGDEPIGANGLMMGGAGGLEVDRADAALGTPPHALVVATVAGFSDSYTRAVEEVTQADGTQGGTTDPDVRGDMVFFETPHGGAVFAAGSITWTSSLSANGYDNPVSTITGNVLRAFAAAEWPP